MAEQGSLLADEVGGVPWFDGRLTGFDVETTGVDLEADRIVTAAVCHVGGDLPQVDCHWLIDPGVEIPAEAAAIHGITTEIAREAGSDPAEAIEEIIAELAGALVLCVTNARFDLTILDREARRHGLVPLQERCDLRVVDPRVIDMFLDKYRPSRPDGPGTLSSRTLEGMSLVYNARLDSAHDAGADALTACRLVWRMVRSGAFRMRSEKDRARGQAYWDHVRVDLGRLHAAQIMWARVQAEEWERYFREVGATGKDVRGDWPLIPA